MVAPWLLELYLLFPEINSLASTLIIAIVTYGIANVIIIYSRTQGTKAMKKCFPDLLPAQEFLLPSSTYISTHTKQRYYSFLTNHMNDFKVSEDDKNMKPMVSSAVTWLIAQTKDITKFPLIAEENINFGFSYNLLGLKPYGIILSVIGFAINTMFLILNHHQFLNISLKVILAGFIIHTLFLLLWIFIVSKSLVISSGKKYARALLAACDSPHLA